MDFNSIILQVEKPARYIGGEFNSADVTKPHKVSFCLCFSDIYEVGMSNLGVAILYDILNSHPDVVCERCFAPWFDMGRLLREKGLPLFSLESKKPLSSFDIVGFSIPYEMCYTNVLYMLDLAGIPFYSRDRGEEYPLLCAGGPCTANPEPFADFFDCIFIGDGEECDLALALLYEKYRGNKKKILEEAAKIEGIYVPSLSVMKDGKTVTRVKKAVVADLDSAPFPVKPIVPYMEVVHDRGVIELFRGCYAGCRFCQACFFYRPIRYRERKTAVRYAKELLKNTGYEELGICSLSTGDYENVEELLMEIKEVADREKVNLQLPSLRLDSFNEKLVKNARKSSITFAPEAGTQRLRNVINKNITDEDITSSLSAAFKQGYRTVKLYFMLGLPTETDEDILGIAEIVSRTKRLYREITGNGGITINVSSAMFIPKPVTPFQWVKQISLDEMQRRQTLLRSELRKIKGVNHSWHDAEISVLEGIFARGDRCLSDLIVAAYKKGCIFDGWNEQFKGNLWNEAIAEQKVDIEKYVGEREKNEVFPWDFIDFGVTRSYLLREYEKALLAQPTHPCKESCNGCGANRMAKCRQYGMGED